MEQIMKNLCFGWPTDYLRLVNGPISSGLNPARTPKLIRSQIMPKKKTKVKLRQKNLAMLSSYFDYIFVHLRQKARFRPKLSPNPIRKARPNLQLWTT